MSETYELEVPKVFAAIAAVMAEIGKEGIAKGRSNQQQGYKFRGIDDVYNALNPILSRNGLLMLPRILSREIVERTTAKGTLLFYVTVEAEFDLVSAADGSRHTIRTFGEAMDSADKATNKAMSAAYKYAAMQTFAIPTEGDNDADATTHTEIVAKPSSEPVERQEEVPVTVSRQDARPHYEAVSNALKEAETLKQLQGVWERNAPIVKTLPTDWQLNLTEFKNELKDGFLAKVAATP